MNKTITLIGINFYPEDTAIGIYSTQMAEYLSERGYKINVITGFPYYPHWEIKESYKNKSTFYKETHNNISVFRYKQYVPKRPYFLKRIIHLLDFTFGAYINSFKIKQTNLVIVVVPFTSTILVGWFLKRRLKAKLWTHVQDFEFDAAKQSGVSKQKYNILFKPLFLLEKFLLNKSDRTSSISRTMLLKLKSKTSSKAIYFPNWIPQKTDNDISDKLHPFLISNKFKILYSGNIGEKQDWEFFIDFLEKLKQFTNVELCVVGQGSKKDWLLENTKKYPFLKVYNPVPFEELNNLLISADLHVLFQKSDVLDTVMPSKILGMMASGKPSIITGHLESEVSKIILESNGGLYLSNNIEDVLKAFKTLYSNKKLRLKLGCSANEYVLKNYAKVKILKGFENEIQNLLNTDI